MGVHLFVVAQHQQKVKVPDLDQSTCQCSRISVVRISSTSVAVALVLLEPEMAIFFVDLLSIRALAKYDQEPITRCMV